MLAARVRCLVAAAAVAAAVGSLGSIPGAGAAASPPPAVASVTVSNPDANTTLKATWPPAAGAEFYVAQAIAGGKFYGQAWCYEADCTSVSIPTVPVNKFYTVNVYAANSAGYSPAKASLPFPVTSGCLDGGDLCTTVTVASSKGATTLRGQGFQNSRPLPADELAALQPRFWRMAVNQYDYSLFDNARAGGAKVIAILSDAWLAATADPTTGRARAPWADWNAYRSFVRSYATTIISSGHNPEYWDVQNEPGLPNYLSPADTAAWTPALMLEQFKAAYEEIRAVDPIAKVIGPGVASYTTVARPTVLDLKTFLDYVQTNGIQLGAITWHEVNLANLTGDTTAMPVAIGYHVDTVRKLIAQRNVGNPAILISEYGAQQIHLLAGWTVGYLANFELANVDGANHTCWEAEGYPTFNECVNRSLSGLFTSDATQRLANYWVHTYYAGMTGDRVATHTSTAAIDTYAAADAAGTVRVLVGRHETCIPSLPYGCAQGLLPAPVAKTVTLDVDASPTVLQWHVVVSRIPATTAPVAAPMSMLDTTMMSAAGRVHIPLTAVNDGDAITITLTPSI